MKHINMCSTCFALICINNIVELIKCKKLLKKNTDSRMWHWYILICQKWLLRAKKRGDWWACTSLKQSTRKWKIEHLTKLLGQSKSKRQHWSKILKQKKKIKIKIKWVNSKSSKIRARIGLQKRNCFIF